MNDRKKPAILERVQCSLFLRVASPSHLRDPSCQLTLSSHGCVRFRQGKQCSLKGVKSRYVSRFQALSLKTGSPLHQCPVIYTAFLNKSGTLGQTVSLWRLNQAPPGASLELQGKHRGVSPITDPRSPGPSSHCPTDR